ncbi:hypothetical protein JRO89_XSUnG0088400 [Xanthoceras sorbifolium]|uniref:Cation/H+ exchanger transmembrane domain-containing protein n=1 Tax=Xanthoceras sorbifolium TaxID=99658 RepID=A0ABQ8GZJ2_9ROSI|nr:hypothetical protein JRO89_XSUnG0088400 [Xanthoceras sorbifolium]
MFALIAFIVFTVLRPLMLWIVKNTPEGKPVKSIYRLILVVLLIIAMLSDAGGTHYLNGAQIVGLIIPAGPPLGSALVEKSELIMSELLLPFFFIHVGQRTNVQMITNWKALWALIFILMVQSFSKMIGSLSSLLYINTGVRNAILLSFILNFKVLNSSALTCAIKNRANEVDELACRRSNASCSKSNVNSAPETYHSYYQLEHGYNEPAHIKDQVEDRQRLKKSEAALCKLQISVRNQLIYEKHN